MEPTHKVVENWLTHKPKSNAFWITAFLTSILLAINYLFFRDIFQFDSLLTATKQSVFSEHQFWRAWTTLLVHADTEHLLSNLLLFIPLTYLLFGYYGAFLFPFFGLLVGGAINLCVLSTMPNTTVLLGISGVVYWMGATWLTLFLLIDHRKKFRYNFAISLFLVMLLFVPDKYQPHISYLSHFLGFTAGIASAFLFYFFNRNAFKQAEKIELLLPPDSSTLPEHV